MGSFFYSIHTMIREAHACTVILEKEYPSPFINCPVCNRFKNEVNTSMGPGIKIGVETVDAICYTAKNAVNSMNFLISRNTFCIYAPLSTNISCNVFSNCTKSSNIGRYRALIY